MGLGRPGRGARCDLVALIDACAEYPDPTVDEICGGSNCEMISRIMLTDRLGCQLDEGLRSTLAELVNHCDLLLAEDTISGLNGR
eukprot:SAG31_NODE_3144_length_4625_cov_3.108926_3_plen_85_part_00